MAKELRTVLSILPSAIKETRSLDRTNAKEKFHAWIERQAGVGAMMLALGPMALAQDRGPSGTIAFSGGAVALRFGYSGATERSISKEEVPVFNGRPQHRGRRRSERRGFRPSLQHDEPTAIGPGSMSQPESEPRLPRWFESNSALPRDERPPGCVDVDDDAHSDFCQCDDRSTSAIVAPDSGCDILPGNCCGLVML